MQGSRGRRAVAQDAHTTARRGRRRERGAVLVEAVLIIPVIVLLTFGAMEFGFAFNEQGDIRAATRSAGRAASTQPKAPNDVFEQAAIDALNGTAGNLPNATPTFALVYDSEDGAFEPSSRDECVGNCMVFEWIGDEFTKNGTATWDPVDRAACAGASDRVGVFLEAHHDFITGLFGGGGLDLTARTVMALEPFPGADCA